MDDHFKTMVTDSSVAGFRPGKAPRKIVERRFQKEVMGQVKNEVILASLEQLAEDFDIAPLSPPNLDPSSVIIPENGPMVYEFEVEVRPQFDLPAYKGLKLIRYTHTFTKEEIDTQVSSMVEPLGTKVDKKNPVVAEGDYLTLDAIINDGDAKIGEIKDLEIRVNKQLAFRDGVAEKFIEQIGGAKPGDTRDVDIKLSSVVTNEALAGKVVKAKVTVKGLQTLELPELTGEILGAFGCKNEDQFRELGEVVLKRRLDYQQRQSSRNQILELIAGTTNWELPQDLLRRQAKKALSRKVMDMQSNGLSDNEINARVRVLQQDVLKSTAAALKEHFVLQKIAEIEKLEVSDDDLNLEIERIAQQNDESPRKVRARLEKEDLIEALAVEVIERKSLDLVLDSAEYTEQPLPSHDTLITGTAEADAAPQDQGVSKE
jgi:trigger factor